MTPCLATPAQAVRSVGLRYVNDDTPGYRRHRRGKGFVYLNCEGQPLKDKVELERIRKLGIPPAYANVWICRYANGHLQATGRDAAGRKQYRYHELWQKMRSQSKYERLLAFGTLLPQLRRRVSRDLRRGGVDRQSVVAAVVRLLDVTWIRVGNDEYAKANKSYGLTTMLCKHATLGRKRICFCFRGKSGIEHEIDAEAPEVAAIVRRCSELPGQRLFQFRDPDGAVHPIASDDVNDYLREVLGDDFTAKDFRTWGGTVYAASILAQATWEESVASRRREIVAAVKQTAARLGNRPAVCRKHYIHPAVIERYEAGELSQQMNPRPDPDRPAPRAALRPEERAMLRLLRRAASQPLKRKKAG